MNQPSLSICIATMNRAAFIGATLDSILSQATDAIEIVLVDGASTDNTEAIIKDYQTRYPGIRYERLAAKGGVDQDYSRAVALARGDYCWLFTDDDVMKPGAIAAVLAEVARATHDLIVVNSEVRNTDLSEVLAERSMAVPPRREYSAAESEELFVDAGGYLSFIGGVVIRRSIWNARDKTSYFGTVFVHIGVIFQEPLPAGAVVLGEPRIAIRYGNSLWTPSSFEISLFKWPRLIWSFPAFSAAAKQKLSAEEPWNSLTALMIFRARGAFSINEYRRLLADRLPLRQRFAARAIAATPGWLLNVGLLAYLTVAGRRHSQPALRRVDLQKSRYYYRQLFAGARTRLTRDSRANPIR